MLGANTPNLQHGKPCLHDCVFGSMRRPAKEASTPEQGEHAVNLLVEYFLMFANIVKVLFTTYFGHTSAHG